MNTQEICNYLSQHSLMRLSQDYKLPLRTLTRIKSGQSKTRAATIEQVSKAIKKDMRKQAAVA